VVKFAQVTRFSAGQLRLDSGICIAALQIVVIPCAFAALIRSLGAFAIGDARVPRLTAGALLRVLRVIGWGWVWAGVVVL
jgi:hypothetical protein